MNDLTVLYYKNYYSCPKYDPQERILYGKICGISDLVDYMSEKESDVEIEFHQAVDDYLEFCKEIGKDPENQRLLFKSTYIYKERIIYDCYKNQDERDSIKLRRVSIFLSI